MKKTSITLVDDHRLFRSGLVSLIRSFENYEVLFEAGSGLEFCNKISKKLQPDIVLLDLNMPGMDGFQTSVWIKQNYPETRVIVLSMFEDAEKVLAMVRTGIKGYLLKDADPSEFKTALDCVSNDNVYFPPFVTRYLAASFSNPDSGISLNKREIEFLKLAGSELTYKEIASKMCVSLRTVDGYRDQLFMKLNIKNRVGLVLYAIKNKILEI